MCACVCGCCVGSNSKQKECVIFDFLEGVVMKVITVKNYEELSRTAADIIKAQIDEKKNSVLGLATGTSPLGTYADLVSDCKRGETEFLRCYYA